MIDWTRALKEGVVSGTLAGLFSAVVLMVTGKRDAGSPVAAINAESHWLWGGESLGENRLTLRHSLVGLATHQLSTMFWATLYAVVRGKRRPVHTVPEALLGGLATSAAAAVIDYTLVPKRLTPGFEHRLSKPSMVAVFAAIAGGIAVGALLLRDRE